MEFDEGSIKYKKMKNDLKDRTKKFALDCWLFCSKVPKSRAYNAYVNQLIRCSSSVGANYRASQRVKSTSDFLYKLKIVEEEVDESVFWLEMFGEIRTDNLDEIDILKKGSIEILAITVSSINTAKRNHKKN
jgi:four helix bundle protein